MRGTVCLCERKCNVLTSSTTTTTAILVIICFGNYVVGNVFGRPEANVGVGREYVFGADNAKNISTSFVQLRDQKNWTNSPDSLREQRKLNTLLSLISQGINIPEYIQSSLTTYCENCSDSQKKTVEEVLYLLFNLNQQEKDESLLYTLPTSTYRDVLQPPQQETNDKFTLLKKSRNKSKFKSKFKATSTPKTFPLIPIPEIYYKDNHGMNKQKHRVIALPTLSTTPSSSLLSSVLSSRVAPMPVSYSLLYSLTPSTTVSSAPDPVQSVEMPTPPMPPTTTSPIYFYYISSSSSKPPTTDVVESSVGSKPTTVKP